MCRLLIWTTDGGLTIKLVAEDMLEREEQSLNSDPTVKEYSVQSL